MRAHLPEGDLKSYIDQGDSNALAKSLNLTSALGNYWTFSGSGGGAIAAQTIAAGPTAVNVAAILLTARVTGLWRVDLDVGWSSNTSGHAATWVLTQEQATVSGQTFAIGGTPVVTGFAGNTVTGANGVTNSVSGAMAVTAPAGGSTNLAVDTKVIGTLTGLLTANGSGSDYYGVHGIFGAAHASPVGKQVAFIVSVNATAGDIITIPAIEFTVQELPVA